MIGYIKAVIFFEGLTATSGRNLAPIRPHSPPHRLATITDGVAGWFPGPTAASRRPARRRAVSRRSVEAPHELPQYHLHVDGRDRGHHQEIHGGAREALHEAMVERIARGEVGGEALHHQATHSCTVERGGSVEEGAAVGARRPHQEFDPYQATVGQIANEDTETDNGKMEAEAVDCRRRHGLAPGTRPLSWVVDADDPALGPVLNGLCGNFGQRRLVA